MPQQRQQMQQGVPQQPGGQRPPAAPRRRIGVNVAPPQQAYPQQQPMQQQPSAMQGLAAQAQATLQAQPVFTTNVQRAAAAAGPADQLVLPRSLLMDKEVITRCRGACVGCHACPSLPACFLVSRLGSKM